MQQSHLTDLFYQFYKISKNIFFIIPFFLLFQSCTKTNTNNLTENTNNTTTTNNSTTYPNVDAKLWKYFDRFETEAAKRNVSIDLSSAQIFGRIQEISQQHVAGTCHYSSARPNLVTIDATFFSETSENWKEFVIFHELGHCYLGRDHEEGKFSNGVCQSIMRSGLDGCSDNYSINTRQYYLDELFQ